MQVTEINIYPVKSTRGIALAESEVMKRGLPWDRRWMLVDENGDFITARRFPRLALVRTGIGTDTLDIEVTGRERLQLPLQVGEKRLARVNIWRDQCDAVLVGGEADHWFSDYLGVPCRLVRMDEERVRGVDPDYARPGDEVSFADGFPLLLIGEASLRDLNSRLQQPVSMRRFRPNLVVDGAEPYAEDGWRRFRVGDVEFEGVKNCSRCVFTTVDPDSGEKHPQREPLRTLASYRRRGESGVYFGQNLIPRATGTVRVGDRVEILEVSDA